MSLQHTASSATIKVPGACDNLKAVELHHLFTQDIRRQIEAEYHSAVDAEIEVLPMRRTSICLSLQSETWHALPRWHFRVVFVSTLSRPVTRQRGGRAPVCWPEKAR